MVGLTAFQRQRQRRVHFKNSDFANELPVFAFTDKHRQQIQSGEIILKRIHARVVDVISRSDSFFIVTDKGQEIGVLRSANLQIIRPAVPVPLAQRPSSPFRSVPPESDWKALTLPMRRAIKHLTTLTGSKPHWKTMQALETRKLVVAGKLTPTGSELFHHYGRLDKEI